jgi:hypothetical protein
MSYSCKSENRNSTRTKTLGPLRKSHAEFTFMDETNVMNKQHTAISLKATVPNNIAQESQRSFRIPVAMAVN